MQIQTTSHHMEVTEAMQNYLNKKLKRIESYFNKPVKMHVTFTVEKLEQIVEGDITLPGNKNIHARAASKNMYESIDSLIDKLDSQLVKYKEKLTDHRGEKE